MKRKSLGAMLRSLIRRRSDLGPCLAILVVIWLLFHLENLSRSSWIKPIAHLTYTLEAKTYDLRSQVKDFVRPTPVSDQLVVLEIDNTSLASFGRWPWSRHRHAQIVRTLHSLGARAIFFDVEFAEPAERTIQSGRTDASFQTRLAHFIEKTRKRLDGGDKVNLQRLQDNLLRTHGDIAEILRILQATIIGDAARLLMSSGNDKDTPDQDMGLALMEVANTSPVYGTCYFENANRAETAWDQAAQISAFRGFVEHGPGYELPPSLRMRITNESLAEQREQAQLYRKIRENFEGNSDNDDRNTRVQEEIREKVLRDTLEKFLDSVPLSGEREERDNRVMMAAFKRLGIYDPDFHRPKAQQLLANLHSSRIVRKSSAFPLPGGDVYLTMPEMFEMIPPVPEIAASYKGTGCSAMYRDVDGVVRSCPMMWKYHGGWLGQAILPTALNILDVDKDRLSVKAGAMLIPDALTPAALQARASRRTRETPQARERRDLLVPLTHGGDCFISWTGPYDPKRGIRKISMASLLSLIRLDDARQLYIASQPAVRLITQRLEALNAEAPSAVSTQVHALQEQLKEEEATVIPKIRRDVASMQRVLKKVAHRPEIVADLRKRLAAPLKNLLTYDIKPATLREDLEKQVSGRIIIIGATATAAGDFAPTPLADKDPNVAVHANILNMLLTRNFIRRISTYTKALPFCWIIPTLVALFMIGPVSYGMGFVMYAVMAVGYASVATGFLVYRGVWIDLVGPELVLLLCFLWIARRKYNDEERNKRSIQKMFSSYLDEKVVKELINDPTLWEELGGRERHITAFFSDLEGFTTLSEMLTPEEVSQMLTDYLSPMTKIILDHEGLRDKYIGDAIVAAYGAPVPYPDHAAKACLSAIEQQQAMARLREEWTARKVPWYLKIKAAGFDLRVRIGLNSGLAKVGNFGARDYKSYTMIGDTVNLASRLEGANKEFHTYILISESTYVLARDWIEVRELDRIRVKGKLEPVTVYEPLCRKGQLSDTKAEVVRRFDAALELYRKCLFDEAKSAFQAILAIDPTDGPTIAFIARCENMQFRSTVGAEWDGVYEMQHK
jgi:class 3 adenylate cyclase